MSLADMNICFKDYPTERLLISSIRSRLTPEENQLREAILDDIIKTGKPSPVSKLQMKGICNLERVVKGLVEKKIIVLDAVNENINFAYPVSALPTAHRVTLADGRSFFAMCAVDALGATYTFDQDVRIKSQCAQCGEVVFIEIINKQISCLQPKSLYVLHADLSLSDNWACSC